MLTLASCRGGHDGTTQDAAPEARPEGSERSESPAEPTRGTDTRVVANVVVRSPEDVRRDGNHLVGSGSAYLLLHAHNPVDWYPWSPEALALARDSGRPVFLSIGYVSCHWCHVMEDEVFERDEVASVLNAHFVSIKVDREERPDLDATYMASLEAMTGSGGWPMSLFLTPGLQPFYGATYLPRDRFLAVAAKAWEQFSTARPTSRATRPRSSDGSRASRRPRAPRPST